VEPGAIDRATYRRRVVDAELDELLAALPAVCLDGAKGVGKTSTAQQRAVTTVRLDDPAVAQVVAAQPERLVAGAPPVLIDEWQRFPSSWDLVRRAVDDEPAPGRFLLTGSATPAARPTHSGAGRIVSMRMHPLTLPERGVETPTVSLSTLLTGARPVLAGRTQVGLEEYTDEILTGGFPGMRFPSGRAQRAALDGYLDRIVDADLAEIGVEVRNPRTVARWLSAYAAAVSTTASYETIRRAAAAGDGTAPAKSTTIPYRDALERLWIVDPVPGWLPTSNHLRRLVSAAKHHVVDPALAARLVGVGADALLSGRGPGVPHRDGTYLGALFESLATLSVRVFAQAGEARVHHFRTKGGEREVDLIVVRSDQRVVAVEVKLSRAVEDRHVAHLHWLADRLGDDLLDAIVLTTGADAYRRADGIGVVPLALLGP
jgi:uncharacterized protein